MSAPALVCLVALQGFPGAGSGEPKEDLPGLLLVRRRAAPSRAPTSKLGAMMRVDSVLSFVDCDFINRLIPRSVYYALLR